MRKCGLCEPDGIDGREDQEGCSDLIACGECVRDAIDSEQSEGRDEADKETRGEDMEASDLPPCSKKDRWKRRMRVAESALGNKGTEAKEVPGRGDVVASFVPEVRKAKKREMKQGDCSEEWREEEHER